MKPAFFLLLFLSTLSYAQLKLEGTIFLYQNKGKNHVLEDVSISALGSGSIVTNTKGHYSFTFDNSVDVTKLSVMKRGYEIINQEDLSMVELKKKQHLNIYLDVEGNTEKRKRELLDAATLQMKKRRDEYYRILDNGGITAEHLKKKLEIEAGKSFEGFEELRSHIYQKFGADSKMLDKVVSSLVRMNLNHTNQEVEKIKQYTLNGDLHSALALLDFEQEFKQVERNNVLIKSAFEHNMAKKEKFMSSIPLLFSNGLYSKVDSVHQLAIMADTADKNTLYSYAYFLSNQKRFTLAIDICQRLIESLNGESNYLQAQALNLLGNLLSDINEYPEARQHYEEALNIYRRLIIQKPDLYKSSLAITLSNLGVLLNANNRKLEAQKYFKEALGLYRQLTKEEPEVYVVNIVPTLNNVGAFLEEIGQMEEAKKYYEEALNLIRHLAAKNPETYEYFAATIFNNLGILFNISGQKLDAQIHYNKALEIQRRLVIKNPLAYETEVAATLINLGILLSDIGQEKDAKRHYEEALVVLRHLAIEHPNGYESDVATTLNNLGALLTSMNEIQEAKKHYDEALEIRRRLATKNPDVYNSEVAKTLDNLGNLLNNTGQKLNAKECYNEALELFKNLAEITPEVYEKEVALTIHKLGCLLVDIDQKKEATEIYKEAVEIHQRLTNKSQKPSRIDLVKSAYQLANFSLKLNFYDSCVNYFKEALSHVKVLYKQEHTYDSTVAAILSDLIQVYKLTSRTDSLIRYSREYYDFVLRITETKRDANWLMKTISASESIAQGYNDLCASDSAVNNYTNALYHTNNFLQLIDYVLQNGQRGDKNLIKISASYKLKASWYALHARQAYKAEQYSREALIADPATSSAKTNLAHALLLQNRYDEAEHLYQSFKNQPYEQDISKTYVEVVLNELRQLACSGAIPTEHKAEVEKVKKILRE